MTNTDYHDGGSAPSRTRTDRMNRRELLAGILPLSIATVLPAGAVIATRPNQRSFPLGHGRCGDDRLLADVCPVCDVPHVRFRDDSVHGRGCHTPDLIARIEQLQEEVGKAGGQLNKLRDVTAIATSKGNADYDHYLHGMANGMILAVSIMEKSEAEFLSSGEHR